MRQRVATLMAASTVVNRWNSYHEHVMERKMKTHIQVRAREQGVIVTDCVKQLLLPLGERLCAKEDLQLNSSKPRTGRRDTHGTPHNVCVHYLPHMPDQIITTVTHVLIAELHTRPRSSPPKRSRHCYELTKPCTLRSVAMAPCVERAHSRDAHAVSHGFAPTEYCTVCTVAGPSSCQHIL